MKFQVALLVGLLAAAPAFAQNDGSSPVNMDRGASSASDSRRTGDTNEQGERLVCRMTPTSSTSRMSSRRVCRTEAEWRQIQRNQ